MLSVVLEADVERTSLIQKEKSLLEQQQVVGDEPGALQGIMDQLTEVYERMSLIGANTAESRAASILSGIVLSFHGVAFYNVYSIRYLYFLFGRAAFIELQLHNMLWN